MLSVRPSKEIDALVELSSMINSSLDIFEVLNCAMRFAEEVIGAEGSSIFEIDYTRNELFFRILSGHETHTVREIRMKMGEGVAGWVARTGEPVIVPDTEKDTRFSSKIDLITGFKTRSIIALPIRNNGRLTGVLELVNKRGPTPFNQEDLEFLTIAANQIGIAMVNARLYERLKEKFTLTQAELKKTQEQLLRTERLSALAELSQGVAHEVRNPVMSIGGFARRLKSRLHSDKTLESYVDIILKESARLEQMVKDVEAYTAMPEPDIREVKLSDVLHHALSAWENAPGIHHLDIQLTPLPEDPTLYLDKEQISLALINLFQNAAEAMPRGGAVLVSTTWEDEYLSIRVKDNGPGIDPEDLPRIFDPFFTAKSQGSGLGLTTVNRIVNNHRGQVKVWSEPGVGTEFQIRLPPHLPPGRIWR
ncbi:MAG: GAF domain-containing protein [Deltaproteobacteria bacterium]|nr:GAF domain-containing protein [Deltaproteobacteria bacterium]